jgi:transcriptional regulator
MYPANCFQTNAEEKHKLSTLINDNPLATLLISVNESLPHISHIPFHFSECESSNETKAQEKVKILIAHVSNHHPLAEKLLTQHNVQVSLVFHGEQGYISPHCNNASDDNVDNDTNANGQLVPTWNYAKVHITGFANAIVTPEQKYQQMLITSQHFERDQKQPWRLTEMSDKKVRQMLSAITFFTVTVDTFEGNFKLSQNKSKQVKKELLSSYDKMTTINWRIKYDKTL